MKSHSIKGLAAVALMASLLVLHHILSIVDIGPVSAFFIVKNVAISDINFDYIGPIPPSVHAISTKILVMYSGPTGLDNNTDNVRYIENLLFFMNHGLPCSYHGDQPDTYMRVDVVVVVGKRVSEAHSLGDYNTACGGIKVMVRTNNCLDMNTYDVALRAVDVSKYDFFMSLNCGLIGPLFQLDIDSIKASPYWVIKFISLINFKVKLVGMSLNGYDAPAHVQSMLWATDAIGMRIILRSGSIFDCTKHTLCRSAFVDPITQVFHQVSLACRSMIINSYEIGMSRVLVNAGFFLTGMHPSQHGVVVTKDYPMEPLDYLDDIWYDDKMRYFNGGRYLNATDTVFWKRSRLYPSSVRMHVEAQDNLLRNHVVNTFFLKTG